ncbi:MAG TPA: glycosyltransferase family A protein [Candidatus Baltobacteraceae bacterium]|nr:glycosyltransferase family A protein [Candidatus Baltobacteraceae bacterium]
MPRVSICIPNRNYERFLGAAIESALNQTEADIEVIVIDDQSTDDSVKVARSFTDPRVRVIALEKNIGLIANYNRCVAEARSPYVKLLCSDDLLHPRCVEELADALDRFPKAVIAFSDREMLFNDGSRKEMKSPLPGMTEIHAPEVIERSGLAFNIIGEPTTVMIRKDALGAIEFDRRYLQAPDWEYFMQALKVGPIVRVPEILSVFRWHESNASWWLKRNGTSVHDFLLLTEEIESVIASKYPPVSAYVVRRLRFFCLARAVDLVARNLARRDWNAVRRCGELGVRALSKLVRPWSAARPAPTDF